MSYTCFAYEEPAVRPLIDKAIDDEAVDHLVMVAKIGWLNPDNLSRDDVRELCFVILELARDV